MSEVESEKIVKILDFKKIDYEVFDHEPVLTSEDASKVRGVPLKTGIKAMILKTKDGRFIAALVPADLKVDLKKLRDLVGSRLSFAKPEEVLEVTGCERGSVPPFGWKTNLTIYLDEKVFDNEYVNFNIGLRTRSVKMKSEDLKQVIPGAKIVGFTVSA